MCARVDDPLVSSTVSYRLGDLPQAGSRAARLEKRMGVILGGCLP